MAVSGGADSVALLRALLEARRELGVVISVAHFHHGIRGAEADGDERFVAALAAAHDLEFHRASGDAPGLAQRESISLETAARRLRYAYFHQLVAAGVADKIATAHTLDDQAETVLMKVIRGAGTRGLAGIAPVHGPIIRPLLGTQRSEARAYLEQLGQSWREDTTNLDLSHTRNRVRHELLPLLEKSYNPAIAEALAGTAEIAAAEEAYWEEFIARLAPAHIQTSPGLVELRDLKHLPLAVQRRLVRAAAAQLELALDFGHAEEILRVARTGGRAHVLPGGWQVWRVAGAIRFGRRALVPASFRHTLPIPGEVEVPETGRKYRASLVNPRQQQGYNPAELLDPAQTGHELVLRSWAAGDRFWPAHAKSAKKVKDLLQKRKVVDIERKLWPVAVRGARILWMRGFAAANDALVPSDAQQAVLIEELSGS